MSNADLTKLDCALSLAKLGFYVFPLVPGAKLPLIDAWQIRATRDPEQIRAWWTDPVMGFFHDYNIGISTSRFEDNAALLVVDVDNKGSKKGDDEILKLEMAGLEFPPTLEQNTPTGGRHLIYVVDDAVRQGANVLAPGLDIRSSGGFIVGPGSETERGSYEIRGRVHRPVRAPAWCVDRLASRRDIRPAKSAGTPVPVDSQRAAIRAVDYLKSHAPLAVEGSGGDATTYAVACKVKDFGVDEASCLALLLEHWNDRCSPPWQSDELETKVRNAYAYGKETVGAAAPEVQFAVEPPVAAVVQDTKLHPFEELNKEFAFVIAGGGSHILWETRDAKGSPTLEHLSEHAFHKKFASRFIQIGKKSEPVTEAWMRAPNRRSYDGLCMLPGGEPTGSFYNLWRGFAVEPWPANQEPSAVAQAALDRFLEHALNNVCGGDESLCRWLIGFFAHMIQKPWEKPLVSLVFKGDKGVGKNALIERIGYLLGAHFLVTSNRRYLVGNFNGHLERLLLFVLDEAFWSGDKQAEGTLKDLITGAQHVIEHKGKEPFTVDNRTRIAIIGNEDWIIPASHDERRFAVFYVGNGRKQDRNYFHQMRVGMELGGYRLLLAYLKEYNLDGLDFNEAPQTSGLLEQKHASLDPLYQWWLDCLMEGQIIGSDFGGIWPEKIETNRFRAAFRRYVKERNIRSRVPEDRSIGRLMKRCAPTVNKKRERQGQDLMYVYTLPALEKCRNDWQNFIGHEVEWEQ